MKVYLVVDLERSDYDTTFYLVFVSMAAALEHLRAEAGRTWDALPEWAGARKTPRSEYVEDQASRAWVEEQEVIGSE